MTKTEIEHALLDRKHGKISTIDGSHMTFVNSFGCLVGHDFGTVAKLRSFLRQNGFVRKGKYKWSPKNRTADVVRLIQAMRQLYDDRVSRLPAPRLL